MTFPISRKGDGLQRALFLCEDNDLASRFCEELCNSLVRDEGLNWQAIARALSPPAARRCREPMAPEAVACLRSLGAAPVNHRRQPQVQPGDTGAEAAGPSAKLWVVSSADTTNGYAQAKQRTTSRIGRASPLAG